MPRNHMPYNYYSLFRLRPLLSLLACLAVAVCCVRPAAAQQRPAATQEAMQAAIAAVKPALVSIHVVTAEYSSGREVKEEAFGSGVIISRRDMSSPITMSPAMRRTSPVRWLIKKRSKRLWWAPMR